MLLSGTQREGARIGRRAGAQQRVVGWLDAGWQHQRIVVDVGAAPTILARGVIDRQRAGVDLPAGQASVASLVGSPASPIVTISRHCCGCWAIWAIRSSKR